MSIAPRAWGKLVGTTLEDEIALVEKLTLAMHT